MIMLGVRISHDYGSGHSQMDQKGGAVVQPPDHVFGAALDSFDPPPLQTADEIGWKRDSEIGARNPGGNDPLSLDEGAEGAADGFDFGKFGHKGVMWLETRRLARILSLAQP
ncbi:hypothetical protein FACS1894205_0090 [Alphaproteobacteria bacterium]|nr:hypothetical protein FACS1894205_0090 [Alphaproteobacteria bacterium]